MVSTCKMSLETTLLIVGHLLPHRAHAPSGVERLKDLHDFIKRKAPGIRNLEVYT